MRHRVIAEQEKALLDQVRAAVRRNQLGIEKDLESYDLHVQVVDLMAGKEGSEAGVAFFVALYSLLKERPVQAGLVVLGEMTIQGNILPIRALLEPLRVAMDNGARKALIPVESRRTFMEVPSDIAEHVDPIFPWVVATRPSLRRHAFSRRPLNCRLRTRAMAGGELLLKHRQHVAGSLPQAHVRAVEHFVPLTPGPSLKSAPPMQYV